MSTSPANIIDLNKLATGFPYLVFANNTLQIIAEAIDLKTDIPGVSPYNHAMLTKDPGKFVVQNMTLWNAYRTIPMQNYMVKGQQLAFVQLVNSNPDFVAAFNASVEARLARPPWQNAYDFIGIVGQAINCPWIHTPGLEYCSVDVIRHMVNACPKLPKSDQILINNIPRETNPEKLWQIVADNAKTFFIAGIYRF